MTKKLLDVYNTIEKPSTKWSGYFDVYDRHLSKFVGKKPRILEIGIYEGGSLDMWNQYFGEGCTIVGIDIMERCLQYKYPDNVTVVLGDQGDPKFWDQFFANNEDFDIIIDDGGHSMQQQIVTLEKCFPHLNDGGILVVEDTHTSYFEGVAGVKGNRNTFIEYAKRTSDLPSKQFFKNTLVENFVNNYRHLYSVSFYNSQVVFEKGNPGIRIVDNGTADRGVNYDWVKQYDPED